MADPQTEYMAEEIFGDLSGFDEIAVRKSFGDDITKLRKFPLTFIRALIFIDQRRRLGLKDGPAYDAAMRIRAGDLESYFPDDDEPDEIDPDDPVTEKGKDESGHVTVLAPKPDFVS